MEFRLHQGVSVKARLLGLPPGLETASVLKRLIGSKKKHDDFLPKMTDRHEANSRLRNLYNDIAASFGPVAYIWRKSVLYNFSRRRVPRIRTYRALSADSLLTPTRY